ncbi:MAG TPA: hypothetical protein VFW09_14660 [Solirubrobacteraceae bacterium]|nr:hypothetical protein [Solirubrobacteraceae bacterium]
MPVVAVVAGGLCGAAMTNSIGNTVATAMIGGGLFAIMIFLLRDMGILTADEPSVGPAGPAPDDDAVDHSPGPDHGSGNGSVPSPDASRSVNVPRPDRMRGQHRRLR